MYYVCSIEIVLNYYPNVILTNQFCITLIFIIIILLLILYNVCLVDSENEKSNNKNISIKKKLRLYCFITFVLYRPILSRACAPRKLKLEIRLSRGGCAVLSLHIIKCWPYSHRCCPRNEIAVREYSNSILYRIAYSAL